MESEMAKSYQIVQNRYEPGNDTPTRDEYPILFASIDEARARVKRDGLDAMFENDGDSYYTSHYIAELAPSRDGMSFTGKTFELEG